MRIILSFILGYLLGSIPWAILVGRLIGIRDIRDHGSGNMGTFNALRVGGHRIALITLSLDLGKGILAAGIGSLLGSGLSAAYGALLGHILPIYVGFKGGKGLAVYLGSLLILLPRALPLIGLSWIITYLITKRVTLSTIIAFSLIAPVYMIMASLPATYGLFGVVAGLTIGMCHHQDLLCEG